MKSKKQILIPLGIGIGGMLVYLLLRAGKAEAAASDIAFMKSTARHYNPGISEAQISQIASSLAKWTKERNVDIFTSLAIIAQESNFRPYVTSPDDCRGLWQLSEIALMELERVYGIKTYFDRLYEIDYNMEMGTMYYLHCVRLAEGERREALARYYRTTEYWEGWNYADDVLEKRAEIVRMYQSL